MQRHFEACDGDASKSQVDRRIRAFLSELGNAIWQRDWSREPLLMTDLDSSDKKKPVERDKNGRIINPWRKKLSRSRSPSASDREKRISRGPSARVSTVASKVAKRMVSGKKHTGQWA